MNAPRTPREHALVVAALDAAKETFAAEYEKARKAAEPVFASLYAEEGNDRQAVLLPDGEKVGQISIKAPAAVIDKPADGGPGWSLDSALMQWCEEHFPAAIEEYIDPAKVNSLDVIAVVRDKLGDDMIKRRVRTATAKILADEIKTDGGILTDRRTGDPTAQVATVTTGKPSGAFAFTGGNSAERRERLMAALLRGDLRGVVRFGLPALTGAEEASTGPVAPEPGPATTQQVGQLRSVFQCKFGFKKAERDLMVTVAGQLAGHDLAGDLYGLSEAGAAKLLAELDSIDGRAALDALVAVDSAA